MQFIQGDYISCVWIYEARDAIWTVLVVWRVLSETWECSVTWDEFDPATDQARCGQPFHSVKLPGNTPEEDIINFVDANVKMFETQGVSKRIAFIEIHSDDPKVLIERFEELALKDDRIGCTFMIRDIPELEDE
jgi:hypothetical protein